VRLDGLVAHGAEGTYLGDASYDAAVAALPRSRRPEIAGSGTPSTG
jgi:hypothetical protein